MAVGSTQDLTQCESQQQQHPHPSGYGTTDNAPSGDDDTDKDTSISRRFRQLKEKSTCKTDLVRNVLLLMFGHFVWTIVLFITLTVPIAMIIIGAIFVKDCPVQPQIPVILVIIGSVMMLTNMMHLANRIHVLWDLTLPTKLTGLGLITAIINLFSLISFIAGCVWVYGIYQPSYDPADHLHYCNKTLYLFSFWVLTSVYIFFSAIFLLAFIGCCCAWCFPD